MTTEKYAAYGAKRFFYSDQEIEAGNLDDAQAAEMREFVEDIARSLAVLIAETNNPDNLNISINRAESCN